MRTLWRVNSIEKKLTNKLSTRNSERVDPTFAADANAGNLEVVFSKIFRVTTPTSSCKVTEEKSPSMTFISTLQISMESVHLCLNKCLCFIFLFLFIGYPSTWDASSETYAKKKNLMKSVSEFCFWCFSIFRFMLLTTAS